MHILKQLGIILGICLVCLWIETLLPIPFPASVIGLIIIFLLLLTKSIKVRHIGDITDFLLGNLPFFFIPVSVSIMNYWDLISENAIAFLVICFVTMALTYGATVWSVALTMRWMNRGKK